MTAYHYITITYVCIVCKWSVTVRTRTTRPEGGVTYSQAIWADDCFRCKQMDRPKAAS